MREFLTTGDLARLSSSTTERIRQLWNDGLIPAELINPGGKQLRFEKTQRLQDWCAEKRKQRTPRPRPIDNQTWWKLVDRKRELEKLVGPYEMSWTGEEMIEIVGQKPTRMNLELRLMQIEIEAMEAKAAQLRRAESDHLA